jgi:hypothetical protein
VAKKEAGKPVGKLLQQFGIGNGKDEKRLLAQI